MPQDITYLLLVGVKHENGHRIETKGGMDVDKLSFSKETECELYSVWPTHVGRRQAFKRRNLSMNITSYIHHAVTIQTELLYIFFFNEGNTED